MTPNKFTRNFTIQQKDQKQNGQKKHNRNQQLNKTIHMNNNNKMKDKDSKLISMFITIDDTKLANLAESIKGI